MRVNEGITAKEIRLIGAEGEAVGVVTTTEALVMAEEAGLDLVEVSPNAKPPVCKIIDFGKFLYQQEKKAKEAKKKQTHTDLKEVKFGPRISDHDYGYRVERIKKFIAKGDKVKVTIRFRGRELAHKELGWNLIARVKEAMKELSSIEKPAKFEGRALRMTFAPISKRK